MFAETEYIRVCNRFGRDAENIADDAADACVRSAEGFNSGWVVVRFGFEGDFEFVVEVNDACVVDEGGDDPRSVDLVGGGFEVGFYQTIDRGRWTIDICGLSSIVYRHICFKRLMHTMLTPRLRDGFKFDIGQVAVFFLAIITDGLHLCQVQGGAAVFGEGEEFVIAQVADGDGFDLSARFDFFREGWFDAAKLPVLDDVVG